MSPVALSLSSSLSNNPIGDPPLVFDAPLDDENSEEPVVVMLGWWPFWSPTSQNETLSNGLSTTSKEIQTPSVRGSPNLNTSPAGPVLYEIPRIIKVFLRECQSPDSERSDLSQMKREDCFASDVASALGDVGEEKINWNENS